MRNEGLVAEVNVAKELTHVPVTRELRPTGKEETAWLHSAV